MFSVEDGCESRCRVSDTYRRKAAAIFCIFGCSLTNRILSDRRLLAKVITLMTGRKGAKENCPDFGPESYLCECDLAERNPESDAKCVRETGISPMSSPRMRGSRKPVVTLILDSRSRWRLPGMTGLRRRSAGALEAIRLKLAGMPLQTTP